MKILIQANNLIDYPYSPEKGSLFQPDLEKVEAMVAEILYANPTCYLVSGYRGAGKTSFIRQVQEACANKNQDKRTIFIHSNFSRYENKTYFLRKIIRDLRETLLQSKNKANEGEVEALFRRTFYAVKRQYDDNKKKEQITEATFSATQILKILSPLAIPIGIELYNQFSPMIDTALLRWGGIVGGICWSAINLMNISRKYTWAREQNWKYSAESITDDDIINYYLEGLLEKFSSEGYRIVFVLDELDKIEGGELDKLLKEMKPWLVRGVADFIIVAGQKLTMKYYTEREKDDEILTSLFSKVVHVNLMPDYNLEQMFNNSLFQGIAPDDFSSVDNKPYNELENNVALAVAETRDKYIYKSKRLPRTFMNLIRQDLCWKGNQAFLECLENRSDCEVRKQRFLRDFFEELSLDASLPATARDYITMHLYRFTSQFNCNTSEIFVSQPVKCDYPELQKWVNQYTSILLGAAEVAGLIVTNMPGSNIKDKEKITKDPLLERTPDFEKVKETKKEEFITNITHPGIDGETLKSFTEDFLFLIDMLHHMAHPLTGVLLGNKKDTGLNVLLTMYSSKRIFPLKGFNDPIANQNLAYFEERRTDKETFAHLYNLFESSNTKIPVILGSMFRTFVSKKLREVMPGTVLSGNELKAWEMEMLDYKYKGIENDPDILVRFQYIHGPLQISTEEISRLVFYLTQYNMETGKGNYIFQIIFTGKNVGDFPKLEVQSAIRIKSIRPDLADRIKFILLPASWHKDLMEKIKLLIPQAISYELKPFLSLEKAKSRMDKPRRKSLLFTPGGAARNADDPQKGRWGGMSEVDGRRLSAKVARGNEAEKWFYIDLTVESTNKEQPLEGTVTFYLHDMFEPDHFTIKVKNGKAQLKQLGAHEAFTVGATCENNNRTINLELDLNRLKDVPADFRY